MPWIERTWPGGRIWRDKSGRLTFYIWKQVNGRRYCISTRCTSERAALEHLTRFEQDPDAYSPNSALPDTIQLSAELIKDYLARCIEKGNQVDWVAKKKSYLAWWSEQIGDKDLRAVNLRDDLVPALARVTRGARRHRVEVIKDFYAWLRRERHVLKTSEDPTQDLPVPQAVPEQWTRDKVIPVQQHHKMLEHLEAKWKPHVTVLAGTGWHVHELMRFAEHGQVRDLPKTVFPINGAVAVLVCPRHKSGDVHRTAVSAEVAQAAELVLKAGRFYKWGLYRAVSEACTAAGVPNIEVGRYRHSIGTWAIEQGATPEAAAAFLGHRSTWTLRRFYATHATVPKVPTIA